MTKHTLKIQVSLEQLESLRRRAGHEPLSSYCRRMLCAADAPSQRYEFKAASNMVQPPMPPDPLRQSIDTDLSPRVERLDGPARKPMFKK